MTPIQNRTAQANSAASVSATATAVVATHTVVGAVGYNDTSTLAVAPTVPTGFTAAENPAAVSPSSLLSIGASIFYQANSAGGSVTCTMNSLGGGSTLFGTLSVTEWNFIAAPLDQVAGPGTSQGASTTTASTPSTGALGSSTETVISAMALGCTTGLANAGISDPPAGNSSLFAAQNSSTADAAEICYRDATSTAAQSTTWTYTSDSSQLGSEQVIATFKQVSADVLMSQICL